MGGLGFVLLVAAIGVLLTMQGWRSRIPAFDLLTYIHGVRDLLAIGTIPRHGDTGSYGSLKPPGTAWLMLPSTLLFGDPRLSEYIGTAVLHFLALLGLFLIARRYLGAACASLSALLYGLSEHGLFLAGSLWPNGRPDFYVWVVFLASLWVTRADAKFLAAAAAVWAAGMHVDMALAPAFFILPALWLLYHPPVRLGPLLVAGGIALLIWSPYLTFEATRGFADIRSQLLLQNIAPTNYRDTWCDPSVAVWTWQDPTGAPSSNPTAPRVTQTPPASSLALLSRLLAGGYEFGAKLLSNFEAATTVHGASVVLLLLTLGSLVLLSVPGAAADSPGLFRRHLWRPRRPLAVAGLALVGILTLDFLIALYAGPDGRLGALGLSTIRRMEKIAVAGGLVLMLGAWLVATTHRLMVRSGVRIQPTERTEQTRVLALCLIVPWLILLLVAEPGKPERFWWLWPIQALFLAAFFTNILPGLGTRRSVAWASLVPVAILLLSNSFLLSRAGAWRDVGWAGRDAEEVAAAAYVASHLGPERKEASIGYQVFIYKFMAAYNITNPIYKVGAEFDLVFNYLYGVENTNRCAEGFSPNDEFRIVQTRPKPEAWSPKEYFAVPPDGRFRLLHEFGKYQVWKRE